MQISYLILSIFVLSLPVVTLYRKFDLLKEFLFKPRTARKKLAFSFSVFAKASAYALLAGKGYFSLYMLFYIGTDNSILSLSLAGASLIAVAIFLYIFFIVSSRTQDAIIRFFGGLLVCFIAISFIAILLALIFYSLMKFNVKLWIGAALVITKDMIFSFFVAVISFYLAKYIAHCIQSLDKSFYRIFYFLSKTPTIILGFFSYFLIVSFFPRFFSSNDGTNLLSKVFVCLAIQGVLYSVVLVKKIMVSDLSISNDRIYKKTFTFGDAFFKIFFEMNLFIQIFIFASMKNREMLRMYSFEIIKDQNMIYPICFIGFAIYCVNFWLKSKNDSKCFKSY
jgi:hypothetical protein